MTTFFIILIHQTLFQGMFFMKNILLRRKLGVKIRGHNREASISIIYFGVFIFSALFLSVSDDPPGSVDLLEQTTALSLSLVLLATNLGVGLASLISLRDSWRVGVLEDQQTELVEEGIYRFTRNPYFVSYLIMFAAYTVLLQNVVLLALSLGGFVLIHSMVLREERYLEALHRDRYRRYKEQVPRYLII